MHLSEMQQVKTAPEGLLQKMVAKSHRAASNRAAADLAGSYTWNYEMADSYSDATAERTQGSANVTISESDEVLTITGMFANPLTASYNAEYGLWVIDGTNAGTSSYGDYDVCSIMKVMINMKQAGTILQLLPQLAMMVPFILPPTHG